MQQLTRFHGYSFVQCASSPCANSGICSQNGTSFSCTCTLPNTSGRLCDFVDYCASSPCHGSATCSNSKSATLHYYVEGGVFHPNEIFINNTLPAPCCDTNITYNIMAVGSFSQPDQTLSIYALFNRTLGAQEQPRHLILGPFFDGPFQSSCNVRTVSGQITPSQYQSIANPEAFLVTFSSEVGSVGCDTGAPSYVNFTLHTQVNQVVCTCPFEYEGEFCDVPSGCPDLPCANGGTCIVPIDSGSLRCLCADGYTGSSCESNIDEV